MDSPYRSATAVGAGTGAKPDAPRDEGFPQYLETATQLAHGAGRGIGVARRWLTDTALDQYPITTLGMAFGLGVFAGWLVKRR